MRRRTLLGALVIAALALAGAGALVLWTRASAITREKADSIQEGMTRADVVTLLGPPGDHSTGPLTSSLGAYVFDSSDDCGTSPDYGSEAGWITDIGIVDVRFDDDQRVMNCWFSPLRRVEQSPLENLLWRAKRQWRRWFR
jgi:hypothetical protein